MSTPRWWRPSPVLASLGLAVACLSLAAPAQESRPTKSGGRVVPPLFALRTRIPDALAAGYATADSEAMVHAALDWLKRHQEADGSWSASNFRQRCDIGEGFRCENRGTQIYDVGVSALATLALLGAGNSDQDGEFSATVSKALNWLKTQQDPRGVIGTTEDTRYMYMHAIGTLVMVEAAGLNPSGPWRGCAEKAIDYLLKCQSPKQGWRYGEKPKDSDVTVTVWAVMALKAADSLHYRTSLSALTDASLFVKKVMDEKTFQVGYLSKMDGPYRAPEQAKRFPPGESESTTACAMVIKILTGEEPRISSLIHAQAKLVLDKPPKWQKDTGTADYFYWQFAALALYQLGGEEWTTWRDAMIAAARTGQQTEGCARGSFDTIDPWTRQGGRIYATSMMTLMLESGYRYVRLFKTSK